MGVKMGALHVGSGAGRMHGRTEETRTHFSTQDKLLSNAG